MRFWYLKEAVELKKHNPKVYESVCDVCFYCGIAIGVLITVTILKFFSLI